MACLVFIFLLIYERKGRRHYMARSTTLFYPILANSVSTLLTVTSDLGTDLPREIRGKVSGF